MYYCDNVYGCLVDKIFLFDVIEIKIHFLPFFFFSRIRLLKSFLVPTGLRTLVGSKLVPSRIMLLVSTPLLPLIWAYVRAILSLWLFAVILLIFAVLKCHLCLQMTWK